MESTVRHVLFEEPMYTMQEQPVYYPTTPVTSSHPQSSSLGAYGDMYGGGIPAFDSMLGAPVPPPSHQLKGTYSAMMDLEFLSDDDDE